MAESTRSARDEVRDGPPCPWEGVAGQLACHAPFDRMEPAHVAWAATLARGRTYPPGTTLLAVGAVVERLLLVVSGEVAVEGPGGHRLRALGPGATPGVEGVRDGRRSLVTWRAVSEVRTLELGRDDLLPLLGVSASLARYCERHSRAYHEAWQRATAPDRAAGDSVLRVDELVRSRPVEVGEAIIRARDVPALARAARAIRGLAAELVDQDASVGRTTRILSALHDRVTERAVALVLAGAAAPPPTFCWLTFGSEGRREQTLSTDQDNGVVFDARGRDPEEVRRALLPLAARVNDALAECGQPRCAGGVMAGNPAWCLSLEEWKDRLGGWLASPGPEEVLGATIFFDLRPVCGGRALGEALVGWLAGQAGRSPRFLAALARAALRRRPPLGLLGDLTVGRWRRGGTLDLKKDVAALFVDGARVLGLAAEAGVAATEERLRAAGPRLRVAPADIESWVEAFRLVQRLRLRQQLRAERAGASASNAVDPNLLNPLDRGVLVEALRRARALQRRLADVTGADPAEC